MKPRRTHNSNFVFRLADGNEDNDLWVERTTDEEGFLCIRSVWEPTPSERKHILDGGNIELVIWGDAHPPTMIRVNNEPLGKPRES